MAKSNESVIGKQRSPLYFTWQRLKKNKGAVIGLFFLIFLAIVLIGADFLFDYNEVVIKMNVKERLQWPSAAHWFGTDESGRDVLARVIHGGRRSVLISAAAVTAGTLVGGACGAISGFYKGKFSELIMSLTMMMETMKLTELVQYVIDTVGLESQYKKEDTDEAKTRVENIREFIGAVAEFEEKSDNPTLQDYLENVALVSDLDAMTEDGGAVTMMTLHSAKGLEFPNVFMIGMEENLFPSMRSRDDQARMEEERRLCYVGITRARERLYLSHASRRMLYNQMQFNDRSRFIDDIPPRVLTEITPKQASGFSGGYSRGGGENDGWQSGQWRKPAWSRGSGFAKQDAPAKAGQSNWQPKTQFAKAMPQAQRRSLNSWAQGTGAGMGQSASVGGKPVSGVQLGMASKAQNVVQSSARAYEKPSLYKAGDRVQHPKFGEGAVIRVSGGASDGRIMIRFDDTRVGVKEFALAIAPIIKIGG